jgi:hypothetical protein
MRISIFLSILALLISSSVNSSLAAMPKIIELIKAFHVKNPDEKELKQDFVNRLQTIYEKDNPEVDPNIEYVWVLSARSTYLKRPVDRPNVADLNDDYNRMHLGIEIARSVVAKKLTKPSNNLTEDELIKNGPIIIYNGRPEHNKDFKQALKDNQIKGYPKDKFLIFELPFTMQNTKGQFVSIKKNRNLHDTTIAIITHAYHFPRVARMIGTTPPFDYFGQNVKTYFILVDRKFEAKGALEDIIGELKRIILYIKKGDIMKSINKDIIYFK